jgi:hypothetical protein
MNIWKMSQTNETEMWKGKGYTLSSSAGETMRKTGDRWEQRNVKMYPMSEQMKSNLITLTIFNEKRAKDEWKCHYTHDTTQTE